MSDDIERFLMQAAQRRGSGRPRETSVRQPREVEIVEAEPAAHEGLESHVAEHVSGRMDTSKFSERASHLGEEVVAPSPTDCLVGHAGRQASTKR